MTFIRQLRWTEFALLIVACAVGCLGLALVNLSTTGEVALMTVLPALVAFGAIIIVHFGLAVFRFQCDQALLPIMALLVGIGLTVIWRVQPSLLSRQAGWVFVRLAAFAVTVWFPRRVDWLKRYKYTWALLGFGLVAVTLVAGIDPNQSGARLWLGFNGQYFQPSEILKVVLVIFLAAFLDDRRELISASIYRLGPFRLPSLSHLGPLVLMWFLCVLLLVVQRDLGATFLIFGLFLALLYVATSRLIYILGGLGGFVVAAYFATHFVSHVQNRVSIWLNPWADPQGAGYQVVQALLAFATGGLFGVGWGYGHPESIPAATTDFPLAVIGEQAGLAVTMGVIAVYLLFTLRGLRIATTAVNGFQQLLAVGLTATVALQAIIIAGGNLRLIPLTGITLPFISQGGSSLLANFIVLGLLVRISNESAHTLTAQTPDEELPELSASTTSDQDARPTDEELQTSSQSPAYSRIKDQEGAL